MTSRWLLLSVIASLLASGSAADDLVQTTADVRDAVSGVAVASRIYVQDDDGDWHFPKGEAPNDVVRYERESYWDETQVEMHGTLSARPVEFRLPAGEYSVSVERGKEYVPLETKLSVGSVATQWRLPLSR